MLQGLYVKPTNIIYNRHVLATRQQNGGETIDYYMQHLEKLSKNCEFAAVSGEQYRREYIRDAFINGLASHSIRQRLLENNILMLTDAFQQARILEQAQKQSASYGTSNLAAEHVSAATDIPDPIITPLAAVKTTRAVESTKSKCFFCGHDRHPHSKCPANGATCNKCSKVGHWEVVCRSSSKSSANYKNHLGEMPYLAASPTPASDTSTSNGNTSQDPSYATTVINNKTVKTLVDSGSECSFISKKAAKHFLLLQLRLDFQMRGV